MFSCRILFMLETQSKWYIPAPGVLGWHIGFWNLIGALGFTVAHPNLTYPRLLPTGSLSSGTNADVLSFTALRRARPCLRQQRRAVPILPGHVLGLVGFPDRESRAVV